MPERVLTKGFVVLIIGNTKANHLGEHGTFKDMPRVRDMTSLVRTVSKDGEHSHQSLRHFVTQGLLPSVAVLGCGFSLPACGFVRTFH